MEKLVLIDGNSLLNRAFYATPLFTTKDGTPTNAIFGFIKLILKIISDKKPTYFAVAFDLHAPTFRHKMYSDYKAGRKPMPEDLAKQIPILKETLALMNVKTVELAGYEADDLIGTLAKKFDVMTYIYTGDRDSYQLVDETTHVCYTKRGVSDLLELTAENFYNEIGLQPTQITHLKSLMGDKSDNIPGVAGVGEKSAYNLLQTYETLENIYENLAAIKGALGEKLAKNKEEAFFSLQLATIDTNVPIDISLSDCILKMPFTYDVKQKFTELEFKSLLSLDIYQEQKESASENPISALIEPSVKQIIPTAIDEGLNLIQSHKANVFGIEWGSDGLYIYPEQKPDGITALTEVIEYYFPIKLGLLDVGFYEDDFKTILRFIFEGRSRVIVYNSKEIRHHLDIFSINFNAFFEDVSILKSLAEGLGNSDGLGYCLDYHSIPEKNKGYGVYRLQQIYSQMLSEKEKHLYEQVERPLTIVLYEMEKQGICVNESALNEFSKKYSAELKELTEKICQLAGEIFNINSTQQLGKILFEKLKIGDGAKKNKASKSYKTTAEELEKYADDYEIVRLVLRYRQVQKLNSTYVEGFKPLIKDGKVHTTFSQVKTETGRLSSYNPNLQNIPVRTQEGKELRKLFIASEGNVLLDADYSQIELRLLAHFSGCKELIQAYCNNEDIHSLTASQVFDVPLDSVTSELRRSAKAVNFGIIYGISAFGLSKDLNISAKKAQEYIDKYFESYSEVKNYMNSNVSTATQLGYTQTLLGRRRVINELKSSNYNVRSFGERAAMNMPLQGTSADIIKLAMIGVANKLKEGKFEAKLVLQVHDELIIDCPQKEIEAVSQLLKNEMENAVTLHVPMSVDVGIGISWNDAK